MKILVINSGSSSLKYQLFDYDNKTVIAKGLCERIGIPNSNFKHEDASGRDILSLIHISVSLLNDLRVIRLRRLHYVDLAGR